MIKSPPDLSAYIARHLNVIVSSQGKFLGEPVFFEHKLVVLENNFVLAGLN